MYNKITMNRVKRGIEGGNFENIEHFSLNYIDDSTNLISHKKGDLLKDYIYFFYILVENFDNINRLKIDNDKTVLLVVCDSENRGEANKIEFMAGKYKSSNGRI